MLPVCCLQLLSSNVTTGQQPLINRGVNFNDYFYWISIGALLGFWMVFNLGFTCVLSYSKCNSLNLGIYNKDKKKFK